MRKEKQKMGIQLLAAVLALAALAACLLLPPLMLQTGARQRFGTVQEADTAYYSREMASYTGELDLYRKLLLLTGVWESETILEAEGELEVLEAEALDSGENPEEWQRLLQEMLAQGTGLEDALNHIFWNFTAYDPGSGLYLNYTQPLSVKLYQCRDTKLDKYRFWLADLTAFLSLDGEEAHEPFRILLDLESWSVLALRVPVTQERAARSQHIFFPASMRQGDATALETVNIPVTPDAFFPSPAWWETPENFAVYGQEISGQWKGEEEEKIYQVTQDDSEGLMLFLVIPPEET